MKKIIIIYIMLIATFLIAEEPKPPKKVRFVGFPFGFYKPETSVALGFGGGVYFKLPGQDETFETSSVALAGFYSFKNYYSLTIQPDIYLNLWRSRMLTTLRLENNDDSYFGIGAHNSEDDEVTYKYQRQQFVFEFTVPNPLIEDLNQGLIADLSHFEIKDVVDADFVQSPQLDSDYQHDQIGLGFRLDYEKRDNTKYPTKGYYFSARYITFREEFGSDYELNNLILDFRKYFPMGKRQTIANQIYSSTVSHDVPFFSMSGIGGSEIMRGYYENRYRDKSAFAYQTEYRTMFWKRWGAVAFANIGTVYSEIDEIELKDFKTSFGVGGRFLLIPEDKINLRLDLAMGKNSFGFYFIIEEAFKIKNQTPTLSLMRGKNER